MQCLIWSRFLQVRKDRKITKILCCFNYMGLVTITQTTDGIIKQPHDKKNSGPKIYQPLPTHKCFWLKSNLDYLKMYREWCRQVWKLWSFQDQRRQRWWDRRLCSSLDPTHGWCTRRPCEGCTWFCNKYCEQCKPWNIITLVQI